MKKFNLSLVAVLAMSTFAMAGGDIAPVEEPVVVVPEVVESTGNFYLGLAYGWQNITVEDSLTGDKFVDDNFGSIMIDAGYNFNQYVAVEGRYWFGLSSSNDIGWTSNLPSDVTIDAWGIYVKPQYPVTESFDVYALLGYGSADATYDLASGGSITSDSVDGFSWGVGAAYSFTENVAVFVDYTSIVDGEDGVVDAHNSDVSVDTVNFGVTYNF
jgi:opacity protein-like surface antigen